MWGMFNTKGMWHDEEWSVRSLCNSEFLKARWGIRFITKFVIELLFIGRVVGTINSAFYAIFSQGRLIRCLLKVLPWSRVTQSFCCKDILLTARNVGLATIVSNGVWVLFEHGFSMFTANISFPFVKPWIVEVNNWWMPGRMAHALHSTLLKRVPRCHKHPPTDD